MIKNTRIIVVAIITTGICCFAASIAILGIRSLYLGIPYLGVADCGWDDTAVAWIDANENGIRESAEGPLAGVKFIVDDVQHDYDTSNEAISDVNGEAWISVFPIECGEFEQIEIVIQAVAPDGYRPTTPDQIVVSDDVVQNAENNDELMFGFIMEVQGDN